MGVTEAMFLAVSAPMTGDPMTVIWIVMAISAGLMLLSGAAKLVSRIRDGKNKKK